MTAKSLSQTTAVWSEMLLKQRQQKNDSHIMFLFCLASEVFHLGDITS